VHARGQDYVGVGIGWDMESNGYIGSHSSPADCHSAHSRIAIGFDPFDGGYKLGLDRDWRRRIRRKVDPDAGWTTAKGRTGSLPVFPGEVGAAGGGFQIMPEKTA